MTKQERFEGCLLCGAIGDAWGSAYENQTTEKDDTFYPFGKPKKQEPQWQITDDTQLTLATCEAILEDKTIHPKTLSKYLLQLYQQKKITGIGASTLKAIKDLEAGEHWSLSGRKGEYAAGNGTAMRVAPIAFIKNIDRKRLRELCYITHQNEEAYVGALAVVLAIRAALNQTWTGSENLLEIIIPQIPDTRLRDRLIEINKLPLNTSLQEIGVLGNSGYVVDSIPLAIAAANKIQQLGLKKMYQELIHIGGDTDTNCSIAGQIAGTLIGCTNIPKPLIHQLEQQKEFVWIQDIITKVRKSIL